VSPSKVLDLSRLHRATLASPPRWLPHMELTALQSVVCIVVSALLGYAAPTVASPFRADRDGLSCDTVPRHRLRSRVHPLVSLALLLSSSCLRRPERPSRLAPTCDHGRLPWGSAPLRDISPSSPLSVRIPVSPRFRPQRFTRSRRLAPRSALRTCFIPLPRPGLTLQGFVPPTQPNHFVSGPSLRAVGTARLTPVAR
jgi:hypothetical protein